MSANQTHWLEITEYIILGLTLVSLFVSISLNSPIYSLVFVTLALIINLVNRLSFQYRQRKRLSRICDKLKQTEKQLGADLEQLAFKVATSSPPPQITKVTNTSNHTINIFSDKLANIEHSINGIIQYLNHHTIRERLERLEGMYCQLKQEIELVSDGEMVDNRGDVYPHEMTTNPQATPVSKSMRSLELPQVSPVADPPVWNCIHILKQHTEAVSSLSISPDLRFLASASWDQTLKIWDLKMGNLIATGEGHSQGLLAIVFTCCEPPKYALATGSFDQTIKLWLMEPDTDDHYHLELVKTLTSHTGSVHGLAYVNRGNLLVSGSYDQTLKQWNLDNEKVIASSLDSLGAIYAIAVAPEEQLIASAGGDGKIVLWGLASGNQLGILGGNVSSVESLAISPDGEIVAAGCVDGTIKLWQLALSTFQSSRQPQPIRIFKAHRGQVHSLVFSQEEQLLFSSGSDGLIKIWHPTSRQAIGTLSISDEPGVHANGVFCLSLSPDGQLLSAGGVDGTIKIWQRQ